ncbi:hypothetical protein [Streptomyces sp. ISL-100]|uniref:hypothetical protein n=1 Tax=Streptomyces sp. ISL-100 TaxID=2819173 RepID=UPI001BE9A133|nr:hypothetical protein [Streptomyces sp. ISL-100]MBT2399612.1 hypothetical protein [Streptomyces sp. ISL-100]
MKRSGPLCTLLAGLLLALFMLSLNFSTGTKGASYGAPGESASASAPASPAPRPSVSKSAVPLPDADYAGRTDDDTAAVSVSVRGGKAVAYFCDGRDQESWLRGDVEEDGTMRLSGKGGSKLDGTLRGGKIEGAVDIRERKWTFTADRAVKPSGLYRATAEVRGAEIDGGWILLQNGRQVGILNREGEPAAAPRIDPDTGAVTVDGTEITARPVVP